MTDDAPGTKVTWHDDAPGQVTWLMHSREPVEMEYFVMHAVVVYWSCTKNSNNDVSPDGVGGLSIDQALVILGNYYDSPNGYENFTFNQMSQNCYKV